MTTVIDNETRQALSLIAAGKAVLFELFKAGHELCILFSGGKDSSCVALLVLLAAKDAVAAGYSPKVMATTGATLIENPEVDIHFRLELKKMEAFGRLHGFAVTTHIVTPSLSSTWQVKILSGRGLPSYAGTQAACSVDLKIKPQQAFRRKLLKANKKAGDKEIINCIGTRFGESDVRAARMSFRGESATAPVRNKDGELIISPIAFWSMEDVWEVINLAANGLVDSYSDYAETRLIYSASEATSCHVIADMMSNGKKRAGCGARTGCVVCLQAEDKSLENMVQYDPRYAYASGLVKLNKFLRAIRYDWSRRHFLGRTVQGGYAALQPDTFHPATLRELFRIMLTLDAEEINRAAAIGEEPMFQLLTPQMIVAIDAFWSLSGFAAPFAAWADYRDVFQRGIRFEIPDIAPFPKTEIPVARFLHVGSEWDDERMASVTGLRDVYAEALTADTSCGMKLRETDDDRVIWDLDTYDCFDVNEESADLLMYFESSRLAAKYDAGFVAGGITSAYKHYIQLGVLELTGSQLSAHDNILRRTAFKDALGLSISYDVDALLARSVEFDAMPESAQQLWAHKKSKPKKVKLKPESKVSRKVIPVKVVVPSPAPLNERWTHVDIFAEVMAA